MEVYGPRDRFGNLLKFYNEGMDGGFYSVKNGVRGEEHKCYVKGIECYADETNFGGIVVEKSGRNTFEENRGVIF